MMKKKVSSRQRKDCVVWLYAKQSFKMNEQGRKRRKEEENKNEKESLK